MFCIWLLFGFSERFLPFSCLAHFSNWTWFVMNTNRLYHSDARTLADTKCVPFLFCTCDVWVEAKRMTYREAHLVSEISRAPAIDKCEPVKSFKKYNCKRSLPLSPVANIVNSREAGSRRSQWTIPGNWQNQGSFGSIRKLVGGDGALKPFFFHSHTLWTAFYTKKMYLELC